MMVNIISLWQLETYNNFKKYWCHFLFGPFASLCPFMYLEKNKRPYPQYVYVCVSVCVCVCVCVRLCVFLYGITIEILKTSLFRAST